MALEILQSILAEGEVGQAAGWDPMAPEALRFVLEFPEANTHLDPEAERPRVAQVLASDHFVLFALDREVLPEFLVLAFPGVERVLPQEMLFQIGYELADGLQLVSCEPDLGSDFYADPEPVPAQAAEATRIVGGLCLADPPPPAEARWALANARIDKAWALARGKGIVLAQPDTGVARHDVLPPAHLGLEWAIDILTGSPDPTDPLAPGMANPGHGTATGSVAAGLGTGAMSGAAPEATLVPIRCVNDVKIFNAAPVARAIAHAGTIGADVISMSLGGVPSRAVHKAIRKVVAQGTIVVVAAGNCVRIVVWPARYDETIAAGGTNIHDKPWKGTSRGGTVDICAPAEHVWVARRGAPEDTDFSKIDAGQGTSFATALIAGSAALWLSRHGREAVRAEALRRGWSVQALFRTALKATARVPSGWDHDEGGAGILDAQALLTLALDRIPGAGQVEGATEAGDSSGAIGFMAEELGTVLPLDPRFMPELAAIGLRQRSQGLQLADMTVESKRPGTFASAALMDAVREGGEGALAGLLEREDGATQLASPEFALPAQGGAPALALHTKGTALESHGAQLSAQGARDYLAAGGREVQARRVEDMLARADQSDPEFLETVRDRVAAALDAMGGTRAMDNQARVGLEALVLLNGRPALQLHENRIDFADPLLGEWHDRLFMPFSTRALPDKIAAVGRIDARAIHWGTGFVVGAGLVLTNRHVLQQIAAPIPRRNRPDRWILTSPETTIDFACEPTSLTQASRFRVTGVVDAGELEIDPYLLDFAKLDAALLRVETVNASGQALPAPIALVEDPTSLDRADQDIYTVGYPARPTVLPRTAANAVDIAVVQRLQEIFGAKYGRKYFSPGRVMRRAGLVFFHDTTTLGGCSGSPVLRSDTSFDALGLHFGGAFRSENYAQNMALFRTHALFDPARGVHWRA